MPEWIGKTIGKVRIEKYLARGGMAEVYLGTHLTLERPVAVKVLHSYIEEEPELLIRFQREAKVVAGLRHPNIVQIYDFDTVDGHPYIVMEYLSGPTLSTYLRKLHEENQRIPPHHVARLLKGLTSALDYAHELGMIHRDIKPGNILLHSKAGQVPVDEPLSKDVDAVLTDFGLVRIAHSATQTATGIISGTPAYMSPEQARGDKTDHRTDIYSLGVVLYEMLAGRVPFEGDSTLSIIYKQINEPPPAVADVSPAVQAVIDRALVKDPDGRYQSSRDMAVDYFLAVGMTAQAETMFENVPKTEKSIQASSIQVPEVKPVPGPKANTSNRMWIGAGVAVVICLIAVAIGAFAFGPSLFGAPGAKPTEVQATEAASPAVTASPVEANVIPSKEKMAEVSAGTYVIGRESSDEFHVAPQNINLTDFWIDQYQVTNTQYQQFMNDTGAPAPLVWPGGPNRPVRGVTWDQATTYCTRQHKRLPTEAEWEVSGRGTGPNPPLFPWGNGNEGSQLPDDDTYDVGSISFNRSSFGVFDLVGNVWEWVGEPYAAVENGFKVLRGGRYGLPQDLAYRLQVSMDDTRYIELAGFRCAADQVQ